MADIELAESELVDALGVAWTVHGLYPDPENQPAFTRGIADVAQASDGEPFSVTVGPGAFIIDGEEFRTERQAAERLAVRLFIHKVELLRFVAAPAERDVVRLFNNLALEPDEVAAAGGIAAALARDGVTAFSVVERTELSDIGAEDEIERDGDVAAVMADGLDPAAFALELMALAGDEVELAGKEIRRRYHDVLDRVAPDDVVGREEVVQAFVEAYFHLPSQAQLSVFEEFLANHENLDDRAFLDQFAGHELANISTQLDTQAMSLLMDYATVGADRGADARSDQLMAVLSDVPASVDSARQLVASQMSQRWGSMVEASDDQKDSHTFEMPEGQRHFFTVLDVFRDLLEVEDRDDRFSRLTRIWSGKVVSALRNGEFKRAELWLRAVRDAPTFATDSAPMVEAALESLVSSTMVEQLARYYTALEDPTPVLRIMSIIGGRLIDPLVPELAESEDSAYRKTLVEMAAFIAAADPDSVTPHLNDPRWFLVRNIAVALRRSGRPDVAPALRLILTHSDHRVRVEAVRGVAVLQGTDGLDAIGAALGDDEEAVRTAALAALGTHGGAEAEQRLIEALDTPQLTPAQRQRTIELIGRNPTAEAIDLLARLSTRRIALTGTARLVREAARKALDDAQRSDVSDE